MLKDLVIKNRSYRGYDESYKVSQEELIDMVEHARLCASSVNKQPLTYYLATEPMIVQQIQALTGWAKALDIKLPHDGKCPTAFIIICQNKTIAKNTDAYLRDVGIVAQTILLRSVEMDLGGCMIGNFDAKKINEILELPEHLYPHLILAIGKPDETVILTEATDDNTSYYRDDKDCHYVPKRRLKDIII